MDARFDDKLAPGRAQRARLMQVPGSDRVGAAVIVAELGVDRSVSHTPQHAAAWAGACPRQQESAGKHKGQATSKGNLHLSTALVHPLRQLGLTHDQPPTPDLPSSSPSLRERQRNHAVPRLLTRAAA